MSAIEALAICLAFAFFSLVVVSYVNGRQTRARLIARQVDQLKRRVVELEEILSLIEPLVESQNIAIHLNQALIAMIERTLTLDPSSHYLEANLLTAEERLRQVQGQQSRIEMWRVQASDAAIARARYALNETGRILRKRHAQGELNDTELEQYISELAWAHMMIGVVTLVSEGHQAITRGDVLKAYAYYKNAQQLLLSSTHPDPRKNSFIKELGEIMQGKRKAISLDLMPESDYNPSADSATPVAPKEDQI